MFGVMVSRLLIGRVILRHPQPRAAAAQVMPGEEPELPGAARHCIVSLFVAVVVDEFRRFGNGFIKMGVITVRRS